MVSLGYNLTIGGEDDEKDDGMVATIGTAIVATVARMLATGKGLALVASALFALVALPAVHAAPAEAQETVITKRAAVVDGFTEVRFRGLYDGEYDYHFLLFDANNQLLDEFGTAKLTAPEYYPGSEDEVRAGPRHFDVQGRAFLPPPSSNDTIDIAYEIQIAARAADNGGYSADDVSSAIFAIRGPNGDETLPEIASVQSEVAQSGSPAKITVNATGLGAPSGHYYDVDCNNNGTFTDAVDERNSRDNVGECTFPDEGTYPVKVRAREGVLIDDARLATETTNVTVVAPPDATAPELALPGDITEEATGPGGARVGWQAPTATDENPTSPAVTCSKTPGDAFPLGTTTVDCEAIDAAGNRGTGSFDVTVQDTTAPAISGMPQDKTEEATGPGGAPVSWQAPTANDAVDGGVSVRCSPASGDTFALGQTTVSCTATDSRNNSDTKTFGVTVRDTTAPAITGVPQDITTKATGSSGARVSYASPTSSDLLDGSRTVSCSPASGGVFPLGSTQVSCSASDSRNNTATKTFNVTVSYAFGGFFRPVDNPEVATNSVKAGSAVPVKFTLGGDMGLNVFDSGYPKSQQIPNPSVEVDGIEQTVTAGASGLSYDPTTGQYTYVWKTEKAWAGQFRQLVLKFGDGTTIERANFKFTR